MNRIFISYRWGDRKSDEDFHEVVNVIEKSTGLTSFWDTRELRSGNFIDALQEGVRTADIFMPVVTKSYISFGKEGGRSEDKDFCLLEYAAAVVAGKKIVPFFFGVEGNTITVSYEDAKAAAERVLNLSYSTDDVTVLQKYLRSQNGVTISNVDEEKKKKSTDRLCSIVFDTFCTTDSNITFYKKHLDTLATKLDPIHIFGDFDDRGLTLSNSYVPISFLRHLTEKERKEKEKEHKKESTAPTDAKEDALLKDLKNERLAVIVGDAGQGKSSFVRHLTIQFAQQAKQNGLSRELFFPLYFECKSIERDSMSSRNTLWNELAKKSGLSRPALDAVMRWGKPLFIFDAMDEVSPGQMDALIEAIYNYIYHNEYDRKNTYILFTSRPGQKLVAGDDDMSLDNCDVIVRKYSVKEFDYDQRDSYVDNLAAAKKKTEKTKDSFIQAIRAKEKEIADYRSISRNPFMLLTVFSTYSNYLELPETRFDAISCVIDDIIKRDLGKNNYELLSSDNIKQILGAVSCKFNNQRDKGIVPHIRHDELIKIAKKLLRRNNSPETYQQRIDETESFFSKNNLLDENGFRHEFLAATYAAYYLHFLMSSKLLENQFPLETNELSSLKQDTDYWKSVTEALLCLLDRECENEEDSKIFIEPLIDELQNTETPDYGMLCSAISQFINNQPRSAPVLLQGMLDRGCEGILSGEQTYNGFICQRGVNPYEELYYFPAIYPYLQQYLSDLKISAKEDKEKYLCSELKKEVCALFSNEYYQKLQNVYKSRGSSAYLDIIRKLADAAYRRGDSLHGYVRIKDGITEIDEFYFYNNTELTSITIPASVTAIRMDAFVGCTGLSGITIPDSVTLIEWGVFASCSGMTGINVDENNAFYSSIDGVLFNKEKTAIISYPAGKKGEYTIPDGVTIIWIDAFSGCTGLTDITIPANVTKIGDGAFSNCISLTSVTIHASVISIGWGAFSGCTGLTSITIPAGVTEICGEVFMGCTGLIDITIPANVTKIGDGAFWRCTGLTSINVDENNTFYSSIDGVVLNKDKTAIILYPAGKKGAYIIPNGVTSIEMYAFRGCTGLTSITIPYSVEKIEHLAFYGCTLLTDIIILANMTEIGSNAFRGCTGMTNVIIPATVTEIGSGAFCECTGLTCITIPDSVTKIGMDAFAGCTGLTEITIPGCVTEIGWGAFSGCTGLTSITIPDSVIKIGDNAFWRCTGLKSINVNDNNLFYSSIDGILLNKEKTAIILYPAGKKGTYMIPDGVTSIESNTFSNCTSLTSIILFHF